MRVADIETLVLCGGGLAGISYIGVLETLYREVGFDFFSRKRQLKKIVGVSVGSVFGLVIACGLRSLEDMRKTYLPLIMGESGLVIDPNPVTLLKHWGADDGKRVKKILESCLHMRGLSNNITFKDLANSGAPSLYVCVTNVTKGASEVMSHESTPDMEIVQAILMSIALPPFFAPVKHPITEDLYVDGCLLRNIPVTLEPEGPLPAVDVDTTLVLRIGGDQCSAASSLPSYFTRLIQLLLTENTKRERVPDGLHVLTVDIGERTAFDFSFCPRTASKLLLAGIESAQQFLAENPLEPYEPTRSIGTQTSLSLLHTSLSLLQPGKRAYKKKRPTGRGSKDPRNA